MGKRHTNCISIRLLYIYFFKATQDTSRKNAIMPSSLLMSLHEARESHILLDSHPIRLWTFLNLTSPIISQPSKPFQCVLCNSGSICHQQNPSIFIPILCNWASTTLDLPRGPCIPCNPLKWVYFLSLLPPVDGPITISDDSPFHLPENLQFLWSDDTTPPWCSHLQACRSLTISLKPASGSVPLSRLLSSPRVGDS